MAPGWGEKPNQAYDTKGACEIKGVARFIPYLDVMQAKHAGENWQQGIIQGVGNWLFTLPHMPNRWNHFSGETARILKAQWNCFPSETRDESNITGSGQTTPQQFRPPK